MHMSVKHGFAVASGMELATEFSYEKGIYRDGGKRQDYKSS